MVRYSFLVGLFHPRLHAGLSRRLRRGRDSGYPLPPARTRACGTTAHGSYFGCVLSDSVERVEQGSLVVDKAGSTMDEMVSAIGRVTEIMGEISLASGQQSTGVAQIGEAVTQMDRATQQNAALVEQSAASAESLKIQAGELVASVAVFKLPRSSPKA